MAFADGPARTDAPWPLVRGAWSTWRIPVLASRVTAVADDALAAAIARVVSRRARRGDAGRRARPGRAAPPWRRDRARRDARARRCDGAPARRWSARRRRRARGRCGARDSCTRRRRRDALRRGRRDRRDALADARPAADRRARGLRPPARPVIVAETESTARLAGARPADVAAASDCAPVPAPPRRPIAISIDPRDEEHSLMLALVRLASDAALRAALGGAARGVVGQGTPPWRTRSTAWRAAAGRGGRRCAARRVRPRLARAPRCRRRRDDARDPGQFGIDHGRV